MWCLLSHQVWEFGKAGPLYVLYLNCSSSKPTSLDHSIRMWRSHVTMSPRSSLRMSSRTLSLRLYFVFSCNNGSSFLFLQLIFTFTKYEPSYNVNVVSSLSLTTWIIFLLFLFKKLNPPNTQAHSSYILCICLVRELTPCNKVLNCRYMQYLPCSSSSVKSKTILLCKPKTCKKNFSLRRSKLT
jgi:hypothetical protein